jgi:hypothetical protein
MSLRFARPGTGAAAERARDLSISTTSSLPLEDLTIVKASWGNVHWDRDSDGSIAVFVGCRD